MSGRVLIVDDHRLIAVALSVALTAEGFTVEVAASPDRETVLLHTERFSPGCVLLDLHLGLPGLSGTQLVAPLRQRGAQVVLVTSERDELVLAGCLESGALGWVPKHAEFETVITAVRAAIRGESLLGRAVADELLDRLRAHRRAMAAQTSPFERLSPRERVVLGALTDGRSAEQIAEAELVSVATVRTQIRSMLQKLGVHSQLAAVAQARQAGWSARHGTDMTVHQI